MKEGLLNLQFYHGDLSAAEELAFLMAALEPKHNDRFDVMLTCRYDMEVPKRMVETVSRKFDAWTLRGRRQAKGWPHGCNELWFDSMEYVSSMIEIKRMPAYRFILCLEADDCPLSVRWLSSLADEWNLAQPVAKVVGALQTAPGEHINGNAMFTTEPAFHKMLQKRGGSPPSLGWDYYLAPTFKRIGWKNTDTIRSYWGLKTADVGMLEDLSARGVQLLHGVKDGTARAWAMKNLLPQVRK